MDQAIRDKYQEVIGLEIHLQLQTRTKAYSSDVNEYGNLPNTNISAITLAHPGTLPRANKKVYDYAIKLGLACGCDITEFNYYDRKNYFYPDLPKGYQVTQDATPICRGGKITITLKDGTQKEINLTRIHMEEDAGKSMHLDGEEDTLVDLNRAGVPLLEIVSEPEIRSSEEAQAFVAEVRKLVRYLDICDGNMEEGSLRCDANISVMLKGSDTFGKRAEVKNMNSTRNVARAVDYEIERQIELTEKGEEVVTETRLFDAVTGSTRGMRNKEGSNDYRYFPEPDLQPVIVDQAWIERIKQEMPALPNELREKFINQYGLSEYDADVLTAQKDMALYYDALTEKTKNYKAAANWLMGPIKSYLNERTLTLEQFPLSQEDVVDIINLVDTNQVADSVARQKLFPKMLEQAEAFQNGPQGASRPADFSAGATAGREGYVQDSDEDAILEIVKEVIAKFPDKVEAYKAGKKNLLGMFMGEVMRASKGKADPKVASQLLNKELNG